MREVGLVHEDVVAEDVDDALRDQRSFERLDATEHPALFDELHRRVLELRRDRVAGDEADLLVETHDEVGQPAVPGLDGADTQIRVPVEHAADEYVGEQALRAPRMGCGSGESGIAPDVAVAREVRRLVEEAVVHDRQVRLVHHGEDRVEIGVVDRQSLGQYDPYPGQPILLGQLLDHLRRPLGVTRMGETQRLQSPGIGRGVVGEISVIRAMHRLRQLKVERRRAGRPRARDDHVHVDTFDIHVEEAALGVVVLDVVMDVLRRVVLRAALERALRTGTGLGRRALLASGHAVVRVRIDAHHAVVVRGMAPTRHWLGDTGIGLELLGAAE